MTIHFVAADGRVQQTQPVDVAHSQPGAMRTASSAP
jgi:hypothetical protein